MRHPFLCLLGLLAACGDPLVESGYRGEPLLTVDARIEDLRNAQQLDSLSVSVFWSKTGETTINPDQLIEQGALEVTTIFPSTIVLSIFNFPTPEALSTAGDYLAGVLLVYDDVDGDGRMGPGEFGAARPWRGLVPKMRRRQRVPSRKGSCVPLLARRLLSAKADHRRARFSIRADALLPNRARRSLAFRADDP